MERGERAAESEAWIAKNEGRLTAHQKRLLEDFLDTRAGWQRASRDPERSGAGREAEYAEVLSWLRKCLRYPVLRDHPMVAAWLLNQRLFGERIFLRSVRQGLEKDAAGIPADICFLLEQLIDCDEEGRVCHNSWCDWDEEGQEWRLKSGKTAEMARQYLIKQLRRQDFESLHFDERQRRKLLERLVGWKSPASAMTNLLARAGIAAGRRRRND